MISIVEKNGFCKLHSEETQNKIKDKWFQVKLFSFSVHFTLQQLMHIYSIRT